MLVHIQVPGHVGPGHARKRGIPQGCPLSMMMLAFFTTGWARLVRLSGADPRALADDLMVEAGDEAPAAAFGTA
eukprot:1206979-Alexandrium_andersonii.AAC.1